MRRPTSACAVLSPTRLALALACALGGGAAAAGPNGASVVSGQASISASGKTLTITNTPGTIIQWQGFSIAADEVTRFIQQSSRSAVLNRVVGHDPSHLLGQLQSNGRVFLVNPNGIVFGSGARIDVGGLVASTLDLADADFLAGRMRFAAGPTAGALTQLGTIHTQAGGQVVLLAPRVENGGAIVAPGGEIVLAAGQSVQLADTATPELRVTVEARPGEVVNVGELVAHGGRIGIHAGLIRQDGSVRADRAEVGAAGEVLLRGSTIQLGKGSVTSASGSDGGRVVVDAGAGSVDASGRLLATGDSGRGGSVRVLGARVDLPSTTVDASGAVGGGEILVGGDAHGANGALANARTTTVGAATHLRADAVENGGGGKVVVWADDATTFAGSIAARGGAGGGNGGFVEISGKQTLDFRGNVDTSAARGRTGTLLLDPSDITISTAASSFMSAAPNYSGTAATSNLNVTALQTALATNNVVVDTTSAFASAGNIAVNNAVTWASGNSLELRAHNNITVAAGATINATGTGALRLIANQDAAGGGDVTVNAALRTRSGGIVLSGANVTGAVAGTLNTTGLSNQNGGALTINATGAVSLAGAITTSGGTASAAGVGGNAGAVTVSGASVGIASITASGSNGNAAAGGAGGAVQITSTAGVAAGAIAASGGAGVGTNAAGGAGGAIDIVNSGSGNVVLSGTASARNGAATGTGAGGAAGTLSLANSAGTIQTVALTTQGSANGHGGGITLVASGDVTVASTVNASAGTLVAGNAIAGRNAGNVTVRGANRALTAGAITASGGAAVVAGQVGGNGGTVLLTGSGGTAASAGTLATAAVTASAGGGSGIGAGGAAGSLVLEGTTVSATTLTTTGGANAAGGAITATASSGLLNVTGAITASGGTASAGTAGKRAGNVTLQGGALTVATVTANGSNGNGSGFAGGDGGTVSLTASSGAVTTAALAATGGNGGIGNADGGSGGTITLDAGGASPLITLNGNLSAGGGNRAGTGLAGSGGAIWLKDPTLLNAATVTVAANGGSASIGPGGAVRFDGSVDSLGSARALVVNSNAQTTFAGAIGSGAALSTLTTNANGGTRLNGGSVRTTSNVTFGDALTLGADTTIDAGAGAVAFSSTVDGNFRLAVTSTGNVTFSGAVGSALPLDSLGVAGRTVTIGSATIGNGGGAGVDLLASQNIVASGTMLSNGAPITLVANPSGATVGTFRGIRLTTATFDAGGGDITLTGTGGTTGANSMGVQATDSTLRTTGSGRITLTGTGGGTAGRGVSVTGNSTVTAVDGDITLTGTGAGTGANTLSADVVWSVVDESALRASGGGSVRLIGLGTSDYNGVTLGTTGSPFDYYGPALNAWQVSTASNLVYTGLGIAKTTGGDSTWTVTAPKSVEFNGSADINATSGKLNVVIAPATGAVLLGSGTFRTNGGDLTIAGGSNPAGLVDALLAPTGARGTSTYVSGIGSSADIDAGGGNVWMMGSGYGGANDFNYGINIGNTFGTANVVTSGAGNITLTGFGGGSGASSDNVGVFLGQGTVSTGATGSISVAGTAGSTATGTRNMGVRLFAFNTTQALGSGAITIWGRSGDASTASYNPGIDAAATVAGGGGPVTLTGIAGDAPGSNNLGISAIGKVTNVGAGTVTVVGTGGSHAGATSSNNFGIGFSDALFSTVDGDLTVIGNGGTGGGAGNSGLVFPLPGIGGYGGTNAIRTTGSGNLRLTGVAGPGGTGIVQSIPDLVSRTGSGRISVAADSVAFGAARAIVSASDLTIEPATNGTPLVVGSGPAGALTLSDAALANIDWGGAATLTLGGSGTGAATIATGHVFAKPVVVVTGSGADLTLAAPLTSSASGSGPAIVLNAGRNFVNTAGSAAIDAGTAAWRVYSTDPGADTRGGLVADFKQYDASFGSTTVLGSGNGLLYRVAPTLSIGLAGTVSKVYDGGASAPLPANFAVTGALDGDTVTVASTGASYDSRHAGSGKAVTVTGLSATASNGAMPVYGYALANGSATTAVGTITAAPLVVAATADSKLYDGTTASTAAPRVVSGLLGSDAVTGASQAFDSKDAGARTLVVTGVAIADGNGGNNYSVSAAVAAGTIAPAALTVRADDRTQLQGQPGPPLGASFVGLVAGETSAVLGGALTLRSTAPASPPPGAYVIVASGLSSSNYDIRYLDGVDQVLASPFTPATVAQLAGQRDVRLFAPVASSAGCAIGERGAAVVLRWLDGPFRDDPVCSPLAAGKGAR